jgi:hypothetical protein
MAVAMEMPVTTDLLKEDGIWVCDTAASNHFAKSKDTAYNNIPISMNKENGMVLYHI